MGGGNFTKAALIWLFFKIKTGKKDLRNAIGGAFVAFFNTGTLCGSSSFKTYEASTRKILRLLFIVPFSIYICLYGRIGDVPGSVKTTIPEGCPGCDYWVIFC